MLYLRQSTAATVRVGPFVDETNGRTPETGLTINQADIRLSKAGGDFAQSNDSGGGTHDEGGWYSLQLDATDTNTLGRLLIAIDISGALPCWRGFMVVTANVFDTLCSTDLLEVDPTSVWSYTPRTLSQTASGIAASVVGAISIKRGDTWTHNISGVGDISTRTKLWFTMKTTESDADSAALVQIEEGDGLKYLNGAAGTAGDASITVTDEVAGDFTIVLKPAASSQLSVAEGLSYDVQWLDDADVVLTVEEGVAEVESDITKAIS
jgi:hypothetical protein